MKRIALLAATAALAACSSTATFQTGPDAEMTHDGLTRMDNTVLDAVWARTDIDVVGYKKVMLEGLGVEFRPVTGPYSGRGGTSSSAMRRSSQSTFPMDAETQQLFNDDGDGRRLWWRRRRLWRRC